MKHVEKCAQLAYSVRVIWKAKPVNEKFQNRFHGPAMWMWWLSRTFRIPRKPSFTLQSQNTFQPLWTRVSMGFSRSFFPFTLKSDFSIDTSIYFSNIHRLYLRNNGHWVLVLHIRIKRMNAGRWKLKWQTGKCLQNWGRKINTRHPCVWRVRPKLKTIAHIRMSYIVYNCQINGSWCEKNTFHLNAHFSCSLFFFRLLLLAWPILSSRRHMFEI